MTDLPPSADGFNPTVGGNLRLNGLVSIPAGFNPTVGYNLHLDGLTSIPAGFNPTVGGDLGLNSLTSIPEGFNPIVGGSLHLDSLISIPEGFNPIAGESLHLNSLISIPAGFNPTVRREVFTDSLPEGERSKILITKQEGPIFWKNHVKVDGIFQEIIQRRGNVYRVKKLNSDKVTYLITDGKGKWAHGDTLQEAKRDLIYKLTDRDVSDFKSLTLDSKLTFIEAMECYRTITGACEFGIKDFIKSNALEEKDYTISEIIELTGKAYKGAEFKSFFHGVA